MRPGRVWGLAGALLLATALGVLGSHELSSAAQGATESTTGASPYGIRAERLAQTYDRWQEGRHRAGEYRVGMGLSWFPGVSAERSEARGAALIDVLTGSVAVEVHGIDLESLGEVWLIDNRPGPGARAMPDATDGARRLGSLEVDDGIGTLHASVDPATFLDFDVDQVVVARRGEGPVSGGVLYGAPSLFERLYRVGWRVEQGLSPIAGSDASRGGVLAGFPPRGAAASSSPEALHALDALLVNGDQLFFRETFDGNGRTCATCHPPENNFTLDKASIARRRPTDPLFVAETNDALNHELNGGLFLENPVLMREFGLFVVNADGFEDLANKFVLRSANHLFALALSIEAGPSNCHTIPPEHRVGWGGDGAPGSGTLREFSTAAVIQHYPLTLGRVDGEDFRLPTDEELDALEAFQLELGRRQDPFLAELSFLDPDVAAGRDLFIGDNAKCTVCHENGGALRRIPGAAKNFNFNIGIHHIRHPGREILGEPMPIDNGFGNPPPPGACSHSFSTPSIIEAADTPPFEHNHVFETLEEAIAHYSTPEFNDESSAGLSLPGEIVLTDVEVNQLGALLRVLNALQNIETVLVCDARVRPIGNLNFSRRELRICIADNQDAIEVLNGGPLAPLHPVALTHLSNSIVFHRQARQATTIEDRDAALDAAEAELAAARADMLDEGV